MTATSRREKLAVGPKRRAIGWAAAAPVAALAAALSTLGCPAVARPPRDAAPKSAVSPELGIRPGHDAAAEIAEHWPDPLSVPLRSGGRHALQSCADFFAVSKDIGESGFGSDNDWQVFLINVGRCQALRAVRDYPLARRSFVTGWRPDATGWRTAPPAFDFVESPDDEAKVKEITRRGGSAAALETPKIRRKDAFSTEAAGDGWEGEFTVLVRGRDLNGDGLEDLVISRNVAVTEGTLRAYTYFIVTRTRPGGPLTVVDGFPKDEMGR